MRILTTLMASVVLGALLVETAKAQGFVGIQTFNHEGDIELTEDEKGIKSISPNGYFEFRRNTRKITIKSDSKGNMTFEYKEGFSEEPFEPKGREWLAELLPDLINDGFAAENRSKRIFAKEGAKGVLKAVSNISSDYAKGKYYRYLLQQSLADNELTEIAQHIGNQMDSDYEIVQVLKQFSIKNEAMAQAYINIVSQMKSDYEQKRAVNRIFEQKLNLDWFGGLFEVVADKMSSDYERAEILTEAIKQPLSDSQTASLMQVLKKMDSDYEKARVIKRFADQRLQEKQILMGLEATTTIDSHYERKNALSSLVQNQPFDENAWVAFLRSAGEIGSDYEKAQVLLKAKEKIPFEKANLKEAYIKIAETIKSDTDYSRVMRNVR